VNVAFPISDFTTSSLCIANKPAFTWDFGHHQAIPHGSRYHRSISRPNFYAAYKFDLLSVFLEQLLKPSLVVRINSTMMEMAMLEAHRPRSAKKSAGFATNSSASTSIYSVQSHSSASSRMSIPSSSLKNFSPFRRRKERNSVPSLASTREEPLQELQKR
jgi:hypothetical protein